MSLAPTLYRSQYRTGSNSTADRQLALGGRTPRPTCLRTGASIGDASVLARPIANPNGNNRRGFGHLGYQNGGEWGSVDLSTNYYYSKLSRADITTMNGTGMYRANNGENRHEVLEFSGDYLYGPYRVYGQWVDATEGHLEQNAWEVAGSYRWNDLTGRSWASRQ